MVTVRYSISRVTYFVFLCELHSKLFQNPEKEAASGWTSMPNMKPCWHIETLLHNEKQIKVCLLFYKLAIVAAAICRIYQFSVHPEHPTPRHIYVGCLLNVHNVVGPWTWQVEEMADVSSIETWLNRAEVWGIGEGKSYHLYLLKYCDISPCVVVPLGESWPEYLCCRPTQSGQGISSTGGSCAPQDLSIVEYREGCCAIRDEHTLECIYLDQEKKSIEGERTFRRIQI